MAAACLYIQTTGRGIVACRSYYSGGGRGRRMNGIAVQQWQTLQLMSNTKPCLLKDARVEVLYGYILCFCNSLFGGVCAIFMGRDLN